MNIGFLRAVMHTNADREALIWRDRVYTHGWLREELDRYVSEMRDKIEPGTVVSLEADFSPTAVAMLLALIEKCCVVVPLTDSVEAKKPEFRDVARVQTIVRVGVDDSIDVVRRPAQVDHPTLLHLAERQRPGLVLFSSGSTGKSKAALHDLVPILAKFEVPRQSLRTITFLLFDHIGGFNTLLYSLSNAGCIVTVEDRSPEAICSTIEKHRVELLPTSPTFLNLLLVSRAHERHDLSSLKLVTYGTEVMPESTLHRLHEVLPEVRLQQTYGLSEVGILRSKSKSSDSLWVKLGGEGFETRVRDGLLEIKAQSAMLGYLNAPSPFTDDGWFKTGDAVEVDGEYIKILGRRSEIINVGGEKIYPAAVESVLQTMDGVVDVAIRGESHPLTGNIVVARVLLDTSEPLATFRKRMRSHCAGQLPRYAVPQKVVLADRGSYGERYKRMRNDPESSGSKN